MSFVYNFERKADLFQAAGSTMKVTDVKKWVKRLRNGDQCAFLPFYEKTAPGLLRFLLWKTGGDKALSEDIMQETYVRFLLSLDRLESEEELSVFSYLLKTAKNCLIDKVARASHFHRPHVSLDNVSHLSDPRASLQQERAVELRELSIAMNSLNEKDSEIIWMRDALGMSHKEVASQIGISEQASRQAYVRAKRSLLAELSPALFSVVNPGGPYAVAELS